MLAAVAWLVLSGLVLVVPKYVAVWFRSLFAGSGLAGALAVALGRSPATPGTKAVESLSKMARLAQKVPMVAAAACCLLALPALALLDRFLLELIVFLPQGPYGILGAVTLLLVLACVMSLVVDINKFSLHGLYRDRLLRCFLGASRGGERKPNAVTGFDPGDDLELYRLRPECFRPEDLNLAEIAKVTLVKEGAGQTPLQEDLQRSLKGARQDDPMHLSGSLNKLLDGGDLSRHLPEQERVEVWGRAVNDVLRARGESQGAGLIQQVTDSSAAGPLSPFRPFVNRRVLLEKFNELFKSGPGKEATMDGGRPLLVVNTTINLVGGEDLLLQERKGASFFMTPLHCGFFRRDSGELKSEEEPKDVASAQDSRESKAAGWSGGFRRTGAYGRDQYRAVTLGTAMAISGAAASPNMGYNSSSLVTFLMTLANARLGWWLGNPMDRSAPKGDKSGQSSWWSKIRGWLASWRKEERKSTWWQAAWGRPKRAYERSAPDTSLYYFLAEAFGRTDDRKSYVYLSDGGHFDNLGIYELVRRRCRFIVAVDATADPGYVFGSLGEVIRKVRIDHGVSIKFGDQLSGFGPVSKHHFALGTIGYSTVDDDAEDGWILYLKSSVTGDEPPDILNYQKAAATFPHQTTADQWFSESQFESYRRLGEHVIDTVVELCSQSHTKQEPRQGLEGVFKSLGKALEK